MKSSEKIRLWTIQHESAWQEAGRSGILRADDSYIEPDFLPAYHWLSGQMTQRISDYEGGHPIWAWPVKPDLRRSGHLAAGDDGVRIEFTADPQEVLLSDFDAWHSVLNGTLFDPQEYDTRRDHFSVWAMAETDPTRADEVVKSWEKIFDIDLLKQYDPEQILQATLGSVALSQVVKVTPFKAR